MKEIKTISVLGSTGSIGRQTLDVALALGVKVNALTAGTNVELMEEQARQFKPSIVAMANEEAAAALCDSMVDGILANPAIAPHVYGVDCENIETALVRLFAEKGLTVASTESCTGGMIGQRITAVPGASAVYMGGFVTYTNDIKIRLVGMNPATIDAHTEVSHETAAEMAAGARERTGADVGLSTTGYAGPGGGTEENPVGTVYIGIATQSGVETHKLYYRQKSRNYIREAAASRVMREAVRRILEERQS